MKIKQIEINGYKSLLNFKMNGLSRNNMIYGYNNSGKSNALKVLELIFKKKEESRPSYKDGEVLIIGSSERFIDGVFGNASYIFNTTRNDGKIEFDINAFITLDELGNAL